MQSFQRPGMTRGPERYQYPRDLTSVWNGPNHRHCCNHCRCLFCTAFRWVILPHCRCRLSSATMALPLDARVRLKRRRCPHLPRHKTTTFYDCECVVSGKGWKVRLSIQECDLGLGNPTGDLPDEDRFIDFTSSFRNA